MTRLVALLAVYAGLQRIPTATAPATSGEAVQANWATLVFDGKTIDWIGDEKIMQAATEKSLQISFINADDQALNTLHIKPMVNGVGVPALILQGSDGHIVHLSKVESIDEVVTVLSGLKK